jgi:hypothetical protein
MEHKNGTWKINVRMHIEIKYSNRRKKVNFDWT